MLVVAACAVLIALTTLIHYEALALLNSRLPKLRIAPRRKLLVVIYLAFMAHAIEMTVYGLTIYGLIEYLHAGSLIGPAGFSLKSALYFSAETYTSLGFGDLTPSGSMRLIAGVEALNGLLLIGWTASYTYIAMERFWKVGYAVDAPADQ